MRDDLYSEKPRARSHKKGKYEKKKKKKTKNKIDIVQRPLGDAQTSALVLIKIY